MHDKVFRIRQVKGAQILEMLNCAAISNRFFNRSRSWFIQRLNNNTVNGKPASFTPEELSKLRASLKVLATEIINFANNVSQIHTDMSIKVYVLDDPIAIDFVRDEEIDGFKEYLDSDDMLCFPNPEVFDSEAEALSFCSGLSYGTDERATPDRYPLRSCEPDHVPFIEAIENY